MALYRRARSTRLLVISLVVCSLLTITIDYRGGTSGPFEAAGRATLFVVGTVQNGVSRIVHPITSFFTGLAHIGSLQAENRALHSEVQQLRAEAARSVSLERENLQLSSLLKVQRDLSLRGVAARVIGESPSNFQWSIMVNRGSLSGVRVDMPVISGDGLVGHVVQVSPTASQVLLIIDPQSAVAGRLSSSGETGLVLGRRNQDLSMALVNPNAKVYPNELVVTSGYQGGLYPPGIVVGAVSRIDQLAGSLTKTIDVRPSVDFSSLEVVMIVTGEGSGP